MSEEARPRAPYIPIEEKEILFEKILTKEIPSTVVYEDELVYAFRDKYPQAPVHVILIPKHRDGLNKLYVAEERHKALLGHMMWAASEVARIENLEQGWRLVLNDESPYKLHFHIIGGRQMGWPPG